MSGFTVHDLEAGARAAAASADVSYTRKLLDRGVAHCANSRQEAVEPCWPPRRRIVSVIAERRPDLSSAIVLKARDISLAGSRTNLPHASKRRALREGVAQSDRA